MSFAADAFLPADNMKEKSECNACFMLPDCLVSPPLHSFYCHLVQLASV